MAAPALPKPGRRWRGVAAVIAMIALVVLILAVLGSIVLRPTLPSHDDVVRDARARVALSGGARIFAERCAGCHDTPIGPWLGGRGFDAAAVSAFVRTGPGAMPAYPPTQMSDADIAAVSDYIADLPAQEPRR